MTNNKSWVLSKPIDGIVFDCDSTLSQIEGIDALATKNNVKEAVHELTEEAMAKTGLNEHLYQARLDLVKPHQSQLNDVAELYLQKVTPDIPAVIAALQSLNKKVYVVSAGVLQCVIGFAEKIGVSAEHVFAVDVYFDAQGNYKDFDRQSPLSRQRGKCEILRQLRQDDQRFAHVGDGMNDVDVLGEVDRFIGYGGAEYRQSIAELSDFYISSLSMAPVLPLLLTEDEAGELAGSAADLYRKGLGLIDEGGVEFRG